MNFFSIKDLVDATNNILKPSLKPKNNKDIEKIKLKPENKVIEKIKLKPENKVIEKSQPSKPRGFTKNKSQTADINYNIKIKAEVKNQMIDELYFFLKKKVKKNTLKIIIDEQLEIKNLKNKINFLKNNKIELIKNYKLLEINYNEVFENFKKFKINNEDLSKQIKILENNNYQLKNNLDIIHNDNIKLNTENEQYKIKNQELQNDLHQNIDKNQLLTNENSTLSSTLKDNQKALETYNQKNRSLEINNDEIKNTVSNYITHTKKIQNKLDEFQNTKRLEIEEINKKVKFYQDENVRLSGELISFQKKNENIKLNLNDIEIEKEKISNKIKELSKSIEEKTNIVSTDFAKITPQIPLKNSEKLNDKEQKSLDEVINRIFNKI